MKYKFIGAVVVLVIMLVCAVVFGSVNVLNDTANTTAILNIRVPRVVTAAIMGASLSLSGAAAQGLLKNPLADGSTLGVTGGASLGAAFAIALLPGRSVWLFAALFAFLSVLAVISTARLFDTLMSNNTVILTGLVFNMLSSALLTFIIALNGDKVRSIMFWSMGSLSRATYNDVFTLLPAFILFGLPIMFTHKELNAFVLGENAALNVGVNVKRTKLVVLASLSALTGLCVASAGSIGFVGLIAPHIARLIVGANHKRLLPFSALFGATFLVSADLIARVAISPRELPVGALTSIIGAVTFAAVFYRGRKGDV